MKEEKEEFNFFHEVLSKLVWKNRLRSKDGGWGGPHLCRLPSPLPVFGIVGEPPHVPVRLDHLRPQDVILLVLPHSHRLQAAVELEGLRAELQHCREEEEGQ